MKRQTQVILLVAAVVAGGLISISSADPAQDGQKKKPQSKPVASETSLLMYRKLLSQAG